MTIPDKSSLLYALLVTACVLLVAVAKDPNSINPLIYLLSAIVSTVIFTGVFRLAEDMSRSSRRKSKK